MRYLRLLAVLVLSLFVYGRGLSSDTVRFGWKFSPQSFYLGTRGGVSFYSGTFSSLGGDRRGPGWKVDGHFGYAFNDLLSVKLEVGGGGFSLGSRVCCPYFLGEDGCRYYTPVCGVKTVPYEELSSRVSYQYYGLGAEVNLFSLIPGLSGKPFSWSVSAGFHAMNYCAKMEHLGKESIVSSDAGWRFLPSVGMGFGYRPIRVLHFQVYGDIGFPVGGTIDGIPTFLHRQNRMWEIGIGISWNFLDDGTGKPVWNKEKKGGNDEY